jgi:hypothetical protein
VILRRNPASNDDVGGFAFHASYRDKFSPAVIDLTLRMAELGWMFNVIHQVPILPKVTNIGFWRFSITNENNGQNVWIELH